MSDHIIEHLTTKHGPGSREPIRPRYLVVHDTEGSMPGDLYWLADAPAAEAPVSVHYLITRQGLVYQIGHESWLMWHSGRTYWTPRDQGIAPRDSLNRDSHGIELVHRSGETYPRLNGRPWTSSSRSCINATSTGESVLWVIGRLPIPGAERAIRRSTSRTTSTPPSSIV